MFKVSDHFTTLRNKGLISLIRFVIVTFLQTWLSKIWFEKQDIFSYQYT